MRIHPMISFAIPTRSAAAERRGDNHDDNSPKKEVVGSAVVSVVTVMLGKALNGRCATRIRLEVPCCLRDNWHNANGRPLACTD
jgi:hypothetical protein